MIRTTGPRNGQPFAKPYVYGAPRPWWAMRAIYRAQAQYGEPMPTCLCGGRISRADRRRNPLRTTCRDCGTAEVA